MIGRQSAAYIAASAVGALLMLGIIGACLLTQPCSGLTLHGFLPLDL